MIEMALAGIAIPALGSVSRISFPICFAVIFLSRAGK